MDKEVREIGETECAACAGIRSAVVDEAALFSTELEGMPSTIIGQVIDQLGGPIGSLNLRKSIATTGRAEVGNRDQRESAIGRQTRAGRDGIGIHVCEIPIIRMRDTGAIAGIAELVLAVETAAELIHDL